MCQGCQGRTRAAAHGAGVRGSEGEARTVEGDFSLLDGSDFAGSGEEYIDGYLAQLEWLSDRLREIIPRIIEDSETKKTFFVTAGQMVIEDAVVEQVLDSRVILTVAGEKIELSL